MVDFLPGFEAPTTYSGNGFHLEPLGPEHNERDYEAWTTSIEHIRASPGEWGKWPHPMSIEENMQDLVIHFGEFEAGTSFTYSILDADEVIGCLYIYPDKTGETDAHVLSWMRVSRAGMDSPVRREIKTWLDRDWPFESFRYDI